MQKGDAPMPHQMDYATVEMDYLNHRYCTPQWSIEPVHTHFIDISYIIEGSATYYIDGHAYEVKAGDLLCIPKGCLREAHVHPDDLMECFCLNFLLTDTRTGDDLSLPFPLISQIGVRHSLIRLFNSVYQAWLLKEDGYIMKTRAYTLLILSELFSMLRYDHHVSNADARVRRAVSYITDHLNEPLSVPLLAEQAQLNPVYFCSLFRKSMGTTVNQFIRHVRINHAEMLLEEGAYSITEIAERCGFGDVFYFSRIFKQQKGVPPSAVAKGVAHKKKS